MTASLLPNGKQQFIDANGNPLAAGSVYFYIPGTTTPKETWQDSGQTIFNTNPVTLDSSGQAVIYGDGIYRQVVKDAGGNLIWDQTSDSPASIGYVDQQLNGGVLPAVTSADAGKQLYVKSNGSAYEAIRPPMVDLAESYGLVLDQPTLDQATLINNALADLAGKGVIAFIRADDVPTIGVGSTIKVPYGVIFQSSSGYGGWNQAQADFSGVTLAWLGADGGTIVHFDGVNHAGSRGIRVDGNGKVGMIGYHISSLNAPSTSYVILHHWTAYRCNKGLVLGDPSDTVYSGSDANNIGRAQADSLDIRDFTIVGDGTDQTAVGIHINGTNTAQSSLIDQFNCQNVNIGVHILSNNGNLKIRHSVGGNPVGADKTFFRFESTLKVPPALDQCETEGSWTYAVHDSSDNPTYPYASLWTNNAFNNPVLIDGSSRIISIGDSGGADTIPWTVAGNAKVTAIATNTNTPTTRISCWQKSGAGILVEIGDVNGQSAIAVDRLTVGSIDRPAIEAATLINSWVNAGGSYDNAGYYRTADGIVHLVGTVSSGAATQIFTLPAGYRPLASQQFPVDANGAYGTVAIDTTGGVYLTVGANTNVCLSAVSFKTS